MEDTGIIDRENSEEEFDRRALEDWERDRYLKILSTHNDKTKPESLYYLELKLKRLQAESDITPIRAETELIRVLDLLKNDIETTKIDIERIKKEQILYKEWLEKGVLTKTEGYTEQDLKDIEENDNEEQTKSFENNEVL